jgi:peptide-methionine (S)-S-oxide reductase
MRKSTGLAAALLFAVVAFRAAPSEIAVFAGGCFWGVEAVFEHVRGVQSAESGYAGGSVVRPSYEQVSDGTTGHAEAVRVVFDPSVVSYRQLLRVFFTVAHDPTQLNRQGPDYGTQYRSAVFILNEAQQSAAKAVMDSLTAVGRHKRPIVTQVAPLKSFYPAEQYHQDYLANHPDDMYIVINDAPKLVALKNVFPDLYRPRNRDR